MAGKSKNITVHSIARELGLSATTVCYVLNGKAERYKISERTAQRVREKADELGYVPNDLARGLKRRNSKIIGLLVSDHSNNWTQSYLDGMEQASVGDHKYMIFTALHRWDAAKNDRRLQDLVQQQVEGIICQPIAESTEAYRGCLARGLPLVLLGDRLEGLSGCCVVGWDAFHAARKATQHLIETGCRHIAFVGSGFHYPSNRVRYEAFEQTLAAAGLPREADWQIIAAPYQHRKVPMVHARLEEIVHSPNRPDAILAINDIWGQLIVGWFKEWGIRMPDDISLISMGDLPLSGHPLIGLTTMAEPIREIGRRAMNLVLERIRRPNLEPVEEFLRHDELKLRSTTRPPIKSSLGARPQ